MTGPPKAACARSEQVAEYALCALPASETAALQAHLSECDACRRELDTLRPIAEAFGDWPLDVLRPPTALWERVARRVATETGGEPLTEPPARWAGEPNWREVAPGIACKLLAIDAERRRVSMLVRLAPGVAYPPHRHAGVEELHLLDGELWIDDRKLHPGDYSRAEPSTEDRRVWTETGCTCVLMTSFADVLLRSDTMVR